MQPENISKAHVGLTAQSAFIAAVPTRTCQSLFAVEAEKGNYVLRAHELKFA
jgi:hypothetical protein